MKEAHTLPLIFQHERVEVKVRQEINTKLSRLKLLYKHRKINCKNQYQLNNLYYSNIGTRVYNRIRSESKLIH